jgi:disulfide bond formation protein DsbB
VIETRTQRRWANALGVGAVVGLMAYALFAQYVQGYEACPLCIFQRVALMALGLVMLVAALHAPVGGFARVYSLLGVVAAATGIGIAARHLYLQSLPPDAVPACGPGLEYMLDAFPLFETVRLVFTGSGECAEVNWSFLGLSMPGWVLIWFVILGGLVTVANWRRLAD